MQTRSRKSLAELGHEDFRPHVNTPFTIEHPQGGTLDVELLCVDAYPHLTPAFASRTTFALLFQDVHGRNLPNWVYNLRHPKMGLIEGVLVTPITVPQYARAHLKAGETCPTFFEVVFS
jgi:hypothetical protein